jgi:hypothetical protein
MKKQFEIVLSVLAATTGPLNRQEIWEALEPTEQGQLKKIDDVSKILTDLRGKHWVKNGQSDYINGKTLFTWFITDEGREALKAERMISKEPVASRVNSEPMAEYKVERVVDGRVVDDPLELIEVVDAKDVIEITDPVAYVQSVHESIQELVVKLIAENEKKAALLDIDVLQTIAVLNEIVDAPFVRTEIAATLFKLSQYLNKHFAELEAA